MNRYVLALLGSVAFAACVDLGGVNGIGVLSLSPILDSIFVGDQLLARRVTYIDPNGNPAPPGPLVWASSDTSVAQIDSLSGAVNGRKRGVSLITARAQNLTAGAIVAVSDTLDITLLLDTVYAMPGDSMIVPIVVRKANPPAATVWFKAPSNNGVYTIDSVSGTIRAQTTGGPIPYVVHADSLTDTGFVYVISLADTTGGKMFFSVRGTANTRVGAAAQAMNYHQTGPTLAFQLNGSYTATGRFPQIVQITLPDSVIAAGSHAIDSLNPTEYPGMCPVPRAWALWDAGSGTLSGVSRPGGTLVVTQLLTLSSRNGQAISGYFMFTAQRTDFYSDPLGALSVVGSFVAPLVVNTAACR